MNGFRIMALAAFLCASGAVQASEKLESLKFKFEVQVKAVEASKAKLDNNYEKALKEYEGRAKESGDLTLILAVREELEHFRTGKSSVDPGAGRLGELRSIYEQNLEKQALENRGEKLALYASYIADLDSMLRELKKAGKTEDAKAVGVERASADKLLAKLRDGEWVNLKTLSPVSTVSDYGRFEEWLAMEEPRMIGGKEYAASEFLFAHAPGEIQYTFPKPIRQFRATIAFHDGVDKVGDVVFKVRADQGIVFTSDPIKAPSLMKQAIELTFEPTSTLTLITDPNGNRSNDHSIWLKPEVLVK